MAGFREPRLVERRQRRSLISAAISAVAAGILAASLLGSGPFCRAIEAAAAWTTSGPRLPLASDSVWQLRQSGLNMIGR